MGLGTSGVADMDGKRIGIIGGSIAGCAAAIVLRRAGCDVTVFERSAGALRDRGHGVSFPVEVRAELEAEGLIDARMPAQFIAERSWFTRDGDGPLGRLLWRQSMHGAAHNWGMLWANLRDRLQDIDYRDGQPVTGIEPGADGVTLCLGDGRAERFDVVLGADGYQSMARAFVDPAATSHYAGYVLWRGGYPITELPEPIPDALRHQSSSVVYPGGHGVMMLIPDPHPPGLRVYWAVYHQPAHALSPGIGAVTGDRLSGLDDLLTDHFPSYWREIIARTERDTTLVHPVVDVRMSQYAAQRIALIGDAATVVRPHAGSGAVKAVQDALALGRLYREHRDWDTVLAAYDAERRPAGNALVDLGERIGQAQVTATPSWTTMAPCDFDAWMRAVLAGGCLYLYDLEK